MLQPGVEQEKTNLSRKSSRNRSKDYKKISRFDKMEEKILRNTNTVAGSRALEGTNVDTPDLYCRYIYHISSTNSIFEVET